MKTNNELYSAYPFSLEEAHLFNSKRSKQRFEQCLTFLQLYMRLALETLSAVNFYNLSVQNSAAELVKLAVADAIDVVREDANIAIDTRDLMIKKMKSAKLWVMFPDDIFNSSKIERLYDELDFEGSETFVELSTKMFYHGLKIDAQPQKSWIKALDKIIRVDSASYFPDVNAISKFEVACPFNIFNMLFRYPCSMDALSIFSSGTTEVFQHGDIVQRGVKKHRSRAGTRKFPDR